MHFNRGLVSCFSGIKISMFISTPFVTATRVSDSIYFGIFYFVLFKVIIMFLYVFYHSLDLSLEHLSILRGKIVMISFLRCTFRFI